MRLPLKKPPSDDARADHVGYLALYRYASCAERLVVLLAVVLAVVASTMLMAAIASYGELTSLFVERTKADGTLGTAFLLQLFGGGERVENGSREVYMDALVKDSYAFGWCSLAIMLVQFVCGAGAVYLMNWTAQRQINRIRYKFLESVLRQDMAWFDTDTNLNFAAKITDDLEKLKEAIGEKVAMFSYLVGSVLVCCSLSFAYGWELTLVGLTVVPLSIAGTAIVTKFQTASSNRELEAYSHAGRVVEEVLGAVRTVVAFGGEEKEIQRYAERLRPAELCGRRRGLITGLGAGFNWFLTYALNGIVFLYGTRLIVQGMAEDAPDGQRYLPGTMVTIIFAIFSAAQNIAMCSPHMETFAAARGAAHAVWSLLDRAPHIDSLAEGGARPERLRGDILLEDVHFSYPSRPGVQVLRGLTLRVAAGETVALVGSSGCGKSTVLQLVQRLYDPDRGRVLLDSLPVADYNLGHLRRNIGVVGQEPVLFSGTIRDNIALGRPGATTDEITAAAKKAFAHDFIQKLADGYNTMIGERGAQLSGGQKQRIAIARSLVREPSLLLLDEATSALDTRSERKVQAALDAASRGRTTLLVSHRLSTIVNATRIVYLERGAVAEQGSHAELLARRGLYWKLVQTDLESRSTIPAVIEESMDPDEPPEEALDQQAAELHNRNSMIRGSMRQRDQYNSSLRRANRCMSITSVKSTGLPQLNPDMYDDPPPPEDEDTEKRAAGAGAAGAEAAAAEVSDWGLLKLNAPEWPLIAVGCVSSLLVGATMPLFAVLFSYVYGMFVSSDVQEIIASSELYSGLFVGVAVLCGLATFLQTYVFTRAGLKLTTRLRADTFRSFLRQEMGWFDEQSNSVGALCARLSTDAAAVQGATGTRVGTVLQGVATMFLGILVAMLYSWKMTLVSMLSIPVVIGGIYLEGYVMKASQQQERRAMESASKIATEAIGNVRTVQSMGVEREVLEKYRAALEQAGAAGTLRTRLRGAVYAVGLCAPTLGYAVSLVYGGYLVAREDMPYSYAILVSEALIYGSWMLGQALSFAPNFSAAKQSGARILRLIAREPAVTTDPAALQRDDQTWTTKGEIEYKAVSFRYPTRRSVPVLRELSLRLEPGRTVALVGHSGCGKSTCLQLLQRLYDGDAGRLELDGRDVRHELTIPRLRAQLGIVQQEPVLFDKTIAENIAYGDNSRHVSMQEVVEAARAANVHTFISSLPLGYETALGSKGAQLSGGQKQRIAIARALVRNPRVLLLDEATSALDTNSEKVVQAALDEASRGRTCVVIAHRLSTVQNADTICVLDKGRVVEQGTHGELLQRRGLYHDLYQMQAPPGAATD